MSAAATFEEIAETLGISPTSAKRAYVRGLHRLGIEIALQAELLGYDSIDDYLAANDDRIAKIEPDPDNSDLSIIRIYRVRSAE